jgi:hypothetical protein
VRFINFGDKRDRDRHHSGEDPRFFSINTEDTTASTFDEFEAGLSSPHLLCPGLRLKEISSSKRLIGICSEER